MVTTEPAGRAQVSYTVSDDDALFGRPPSGTPQTLSAWDTAGRVLAGVLGVGAGLAVFVVGGLFALLTTCTGYSDESGACGSLGGFVGPLELAAVLGGALTAAAGGTLTASTGRARWLAAGLAIAGVLVGLLWFLVSAQQSALS